MEQPEGELKQLEGCIKFWESKLFHDKFLLESSTEVLIESTVSYLKELQQIKSIDQTPEKSLS